ncbi:hypothetical protein A2U01_0039777, partial [Trifolium medium]|nr:hypothetical protein [Trifolium medium]
ETARERYGEEFLKLTQGGMNVEVYAKKFESLSRFFRFFRDGLTTVLRIIRDLIVLRAKGLKGVRVEGGRLAIGVVKKGITPMNVGMQDLFVTTVRSRVIMLGIAVLQKRHRRQIQLREVDPLPKDVSTVWARK